MPTADVNQVSPGSIDRPHGIYKPAESDSVPNITMADLRAEKRRFFVVAAKTQLNVGAVSGPTGAVLEAPTLRRARDELKAESSGTCAPFQQNEWS